MSKSFRIRNGPKKFNVKTLQNFENIKEGQRCWECLKGPKFWKS